MTTVRYLVDAQRIVHETIGDETILINLEAGTYHSLTGSGPAFWTLLAAGWTEAEAVAELGQRHPGASSGELSGAGATLVRELVAADILRDGETRADRDPVTVEPAPTFAPPVLQSYSDMQYLLLLDPIHDVTSQGWPQTAVEGRAGRDD